MSIRPLIRAHLVELLASGEDIVRNDAADQFIADHPAEIDEHIGEMVRRTVNAEIAALCNERPESVGQIALFPGLPAAIVIAPGVARPLNRCTWDDLMAGRAARVENIADAEKALIRYDESLDVVRPHMATRPQMTVADVRHLVAAS